MRLLFLFCFIILVTFPMISCGDANAADADVQEAAVSTDGNVQTMESMPTNTEVLQSESGTDKKTSKSKKTKEKKQQQGRKRFDMDAIEKEWEKGDAEEELENEFDHIRKTTEKRQKKQPGINFDDPASVRKAMKGGGLDLLGQGMSAMIFVDLVNKTDGSEWTKKEVDHLSGKWSSLLRTGSLTASVYNIGEQEGKQSGRLLLSIDRGWMTPDVIRFALSQPETHKVSKDNREYFPKDINTFDEEDD